ncbi:MAG: hypothetical protein P4M08_15515 [Oligoflexia bacterium]|nr:hypothetical protein [Oligoflexia bacterium]
MPHLNWRSSTLDKKVVPQTSEYGGDRDFTLELVLDREAHRELALELAEVLVPGGGELRLDLPDEWRIFWKLRDDESRLLIAYPQESEWVATVALELEHGRRFLAALEALVPGSDEPLMIGRLGSVGQVSNVEVLISVR